MLFRSKIRADVQRQLNRYVQHHSLLNEIEAFIVPPALGDLSGSLGAIALAQLAGTP